MNNWCANVSTPNIGHQMFKFFAQSRLGQCKDLSFFQQKDFPIRIFVAVTYTHSSFNIILHASSNIYLASTQNLTHESVVHNLNSTAVWTTALSLLLHNFLYYFQSKVFSFSKYTPPHPTLVFLTSCLTFHYYGFSICKNFNHLNYFYPNPTIFFIIALLFQDLSWLVNLLPLLYILDT